MFFAFAIVALAPLPLHAATLNFSPATGSYGVGSTFSVSVYAESASQAMNAVSGTVAFPKDRIEVISLSKAGSLLSLWPAEPSFSNSQGTVSFEGLVPNPGYIGSNGKILTITFRAKISGTADLSFSSGSILASDGTGANIVNGLQIATFTLTSAEKKTESTQAAGGSSNEALTIVSTTHPEQTAWYADATPEFSWELPEGALEVRTVIGKSSSLTPSVSYSPPISKKKVEELPDGTYYFSAHVRTSAGWSPVSRYRVNIDTTPPKPFSVTFPHGNRGLDPQRSIYFNTTDERSGVRHYEVKIGDDTKLVTPASITELNPYMLRPLLPGTYTVFVTAVDTAGNVRNSQAEFAVEAIDAPIITYYTETLEEGDVLKIRGTTYPNAEVTLFVREGDSVVLEERARSTLSGDFTIAISKRLDAGTFALTLRVKDGRGAQSLETHPLALSVNPEFISDLIGVVLKYLSAVILVGILLVGIAWASVRAWFKIPYTIARMRREGKEAERTSERAFKVLRDGITRHIAHLAKVDRKLTKEELAFLEEFENKLGEAEELVTKDIKDISNA
jgi:hypothetical protein